MTSIHDKQRIINRAVLTTIAGVIAVYFLYLLWNVVLVLYVSLMLAVGFSPVVHWIERQRFFERRVRIPRWLAILILYLAALLIVGIGLMLLVPKLIEQAGEFWAAMPGMVDRLQDPLVQRGVIQRRYSWSEVLAMVGGSENPLAGVMGMVQSLFGALGMIVTLLILPYYLLLESKSLRRLALSVVAEENRPQVGRIMHALTTKVGAWLIGQMVLCGVIAVGASIGLAIIGVPYFYVLGLIAGAGELIPVVGPILASAPGVLMGWMISPKIGLLAFGYYTLQQIVENSVLVPRIMERQVGVSAVVIIVALLIGSELFGVVGALLAVPTAAIVQVVLQEYFTRESA
jgi:predicted PurR-regulated permease PerM